MKNRFGINLGGRRISALLIGLLTIMFCHALWAQDPGAGYELSYIANAAHGDLIEDGRYRLVIHLLSGGGHDPLARATNLCVARTMIGDFRKARRDCNRAVELGEQAALLAAEHERQKRYGNWAIALSNRGVLRAIRGQDGARDDFLKAMEFQAYSDAATRNLARFNEFEQPELAAQ